jgi:hypothetical protein
VSVSVILCRNAMAMESSIADRSEPIHEVIVRAVYGSTPHRIVCAWEMARKVTAEAHELRRISRMVRERSAEARRTRQRETTESPKAPRQCPACQAPEPNLTEHPEATWYQCPRCGYQWCSSFKMPEPVPVQDTHR